MSWTPGPCARRAAFTPAHALGDREPIVTDDAQLGRVEPLGRVPCELRLRLVARRPTAAGNKRAPSDAPPPGLVRRDTEPLRLHIPHGLVGRKPGERRMRGAERNKILPSFRSPSVPPFRSRKRGDRCTRISVSATDAR